MAREEAGTDGQVRGSAPYLGDVGIADLRHDVADVLEHEEPRVQAPQVELILDVAVYDFPTPDHVLDVNEYLETVSRVGENRLLVYPKHPQDQ